MNKVEIAANVYWVGAVDWHRRLFDSLIPLPDGTTYNAYLICGSQKTALLDAVDPSMLEVLKSHLVDVPRIDYVIAHHAEQDHSGTIPYVLDRYPAARLVVSAKARELLIDHLRIASDRFLVVQDGEELSLGDKTLRFVYTPWVHWPETMVSYLVEDRILFSCDFFGSHLAGSDVFNPDRCRVYDAAKRYFAEIMMPFSAVIQKNIEKLAPLQVRMIAPSHGPIHTDPAWIVDAYRKWVSPRPENLVLIAFVSMHGSTRLMVERLTTALAARGVSVEVFDLAVTDLGKLAMALVDAATVVFGVPTVLGGPHPLVAYAAALINALKPKTRFVGVIGSYGWGGRTTETLAQLTSGMKAESLEPVLCKGLPTESDLAALDKMADQIALRHKTLI